MTDAVIRRATVADLERIQEIAVAAWTTIYEHRRKNVVGDEIFADMWGGWRTNQRVKKEDVGDRVIVTELDGKIVGFATWRVLNPKAGEITANAIDPALQGRGHGTRQVREVLAILKAQGCECANVFTGLDPAHGPARGQYYNLGLSLSITTSVYMNHVSAVPDLPRRAGLAVAPATAEHTGALTDIIESVWQPIFAENNRLTNGLFAVCYPDAMAKKKEVVVKRLNGSAHGLLLVRDGGRPVGLCLLDLAPNKSYGSITLLGVLPEVRLRGAATALCTEAVRLLRERGMRYVWLQAGPGENTEATRCLCHKLGLHREIPSIWLFGTI